MYRKSLVFLLIFVILSPCFLFGENISQCDFLYSRFVGFGLTPQKQSLDGTENYQFPAVVPKSPAGTGRKIEQ